MFCSIVKLLEHKITLSIYDSDEYINILELDLLHCMTDKEDDPLTGKIFALLLLIVFGHNTYVECGLKAFENLKYCEC